MNKNICMFVWNHFTNDARVLRECTALSEAGYDVDLICIHDPADKGLPMEEDINGFKVKRVKRYPDLYLKSKKWRKSLSLLKKKVMNNKLLLIPLVPLGIIALPLFILYKLVGIFLKKTNLMKAYIRFMIFIRMIKEGLRKDYDIYHSNDLNTLPQGYICNIFKKGKLIYDSHEVQTDRTGYVGKQYYYLEKFLIKRIDKMIMTTDTRADYTAKLYNMKKPMVVHNYPFYKEVEDKIDLYELADIPKEEPILLYQGGIQEGRGIEKIVESIPYFDRGIIVFIGDGRLKPTIVNMVKEMELEDKVRFIPKVPVNDLPKYTKNAYLGFQVLQNICFNHYSTLSNKLFEYMMSDVPVIASDFPEIKKIVDGEKTGIIVNTEDSDEIAKGVNELLNDKEKWNEYKLNCERAKKIYNWENEKKKFIEIYKEVI
ncbi:glycosyltransferase [Clostridium sp. D2Q-14]|uniref:glycosyltransferase n=1 Tax=Anaeromonas gelatinilytica TaxID=2683194 RepID=UPI00193BB308|nr:glycosyltransferase [Anaeromonas gelatinilytica]MBS4536513.1 glycosyltransferase [Anaeromonas gelatinilytica]